MDDPLVPRPAPDPPIHLEAARARPIGRGSAVVDAYEAHRDEVFSFLVGATRDESIAEDLLQEAFLRLLKEERAGRLPEQPRAWLYRVAANLVVSRGRRVSTAARWLPRLLDRRVEDAPDIGLIRHERDRELERLLGTLRPIERTALLMAGHGFSGGEIAIAIGRSESATRTLMCRARLQLRRRIEAGDAEVVS